MTLFVGVMSGTSMDAVDSALVEIRADLPVLLASHRASWPPTLRERLQACAAGAPLDAAAFATLDSRIGTFIAGCVLQLLEDHQVDPRQVTAIGCHGQTLTHLPEQDPATTLQLGDANLVAERTGITTVNDFRRRDMAAGGQGAPLAPILHDAVLRSDDEDRVVLNLGGIANITVLPADRARAVTGFDTGPANCLMDSWTRRQLGQPFDRNGDWAATAQPDPELLSSLLGDPFFSLPAPKSTGTQYFSARWLDKHLSAFDSLEPAAVQATLLSLTVETAAAAIERCAAETKRVLVCGGGARNALLMSRLAERLAVAVESTAAHGLDPDWVEAVAFAWLAHRTLQGLPGNLPSVTGARGGRVLGAIHPA